ncbi:hypothetical protein TL16_g04448 [Triparma laevis f. inornata]|uniref:Uncharacterized protein n=1 Tax=Triparma laevis f. inornata TaxID=1714386 RepID=A0A9W7E5K8_9STRA|nr:hypothetical protein TL16_g04448 [Triparma laevis f. inornata]
MGNYLQSRSGSLENPSFLKRLLPNGLKKTPIRTILLCGLNNSGKTTLLCNLSTDFIEKVGKEVEQVSTCPTVGVSLVEFGQRIGSRVNWRVWDMSGQVRTHLLTLFHSLLVSNSSTCNRSTAHTGRFRNLWSYYSGHVQGLVYVVDITDSDRIAVARDELQMLLDQPRVKESHMSNMDGEEGGRDGQGQSKNKSLSLDNIRLAFGVDSLSQHHKIKVLSSSGLTGTGVGEGFGWLSEAIRTSEKAPRRVATN